MQNSKLTTTPWGPARHVEILAQDVHLITTDSHGGIYLAPDLNRCVPREIKQMTVNGQGFQGFYEEDEDAVLLWEQFLNHITFYTF